MERGPLTIDSVSGAVPVRVPIGSRVTIRGTADKPLEMARIDCPASESSAAWHRQFRGDELGAERNEFTYAFEPFPAPTAKEISAAANPGKRARRKPCRPQSRRTRLRSSSPSAIPTAKARDPIFLTLVPVPDEPPEVKVRLVGTREPVVTPKGRLPVTGTITDDHGLGRAWCDYTVEERAAVGNPGETAPATLSQKPGEPPKAARAAIGRSASGRVA